MDRPRDVAWSISSHESRLRSAESSPVYNSCAACCGTDTIYPRPLQVVAEQRPRAFSLLIAHVGDAGHRTPSVYQI